MERFRPTLILRPLCSSIRFLPVLLSALHHVEPSPWPFATVRVMLCSTTCSHGITYLSHSPSHGAFGSLSLTRKAWEERIQE
ncbi:hypothetical protein F4824DRAFT_446738 [Ustulina deusta]|nr:hypothetical protein F4823DRAFT_606461 [Ustulina deusta]KAI3342564.1 hypothetical protein F4824DRAFT_446738 [Ustulina deusta]